MGISLFMIRIIKRGNQNKIHHCEGGEKRNVNFVFFIIIDKNF